MANGRAARRGQEDVPTALIRRIAVGAALDDTGPVHRLHLHVQPGLAQLLGEHLGGVVHIGDVGGLQQHDGAAVIARLLEEGLCLLEVLTFLEPAGVGIVFHRRAVAEVGRHCLGVLAVAEGGLHVVGLLDQVQHGLPRLYIVEGRVQEVEADLANLAERVQYLNLDVLVRLQLVHEVGLRDLDRSRSRPPEAPPRRSGCRAC